MYDFIHLHVHTWYSILDGQASVERIVDKAIKDSQRGVAITDHGNMFAIKEFWNYVQKVNGKKHDKEKLIKKLITFQNEVCPEKEEAQNLLKKLESEVPLARAAAEAIADETEHSAAIKQVNEQTEILKQLKLASEMYGLDTIKGREIAMELEAKPDFKPILGCEVYCARRDMHSMSTHEDKSGWHLILLAKNETGYKNLLKIVSKAWTEGFYARPRTDHNEIEKHHKGLICLSACLGGELPQKILAGDIEGARKSVQWFKNIFKDDYYIELQLHRATVPNANHETYEQQVIVNKKLIELADEFSVKLVATNDSHFVDEDDAQAHELLICLSTGKNLSDENRMMYSKQEWFKTRQEMNDNFAQYPHEALENTVEILDKVETYSINHDPIMPIFPIPEDFGTEDEYRKKFSEKELFDEFTQDENGNVVLSQADAEKKIKKLGGYSKLYRTKLEADYLSKLAFEGAKKRYGDPLSEEMFQRIKFELHIMKTMGFPGYFLIVHDFIRAAREELDVWVGPGRGSAAGSAVAYCLGITQVDPVKYDLLFERFLNPDRISLPDIDIDFEDEGRGKVLDWVTKKYGEDKVAHIITFGSMAAKSSIKDVGRVLGISIPDANRLCSYIPDRLQDPKDKDKKLKINLKNCIENVKELQDEASNGEPMIQDTIRYARKLEGNIRNTGVHACGTIICRDPITDWVPVSFAEDPSTKERILVTQYEGSIIEDTGLIKMDFLGLKNLTIMKNTVENIRLSRGEEIDINSIPIDDKLTYKLYQEGRTIGTFQFESPGMQKYLKELQPTVFEDLIAMNALYRPGPMEYIPDFIDRKHGRKPIEYDIPQMEKYLKETYGITVYQEQVMLLSRLLAGFTRGESDTLRKAMGKKLKDKLDHLKPKFLEGGAKNGHPKDKLEKIWADWEKFAEYAFNKSHATCYSWVSYQTAYLKAHYPAEYMAALLGVIFKNANDLKTYMGECRQMKLMVLCPDVNESRNKFNVNSKGEIRFGLAAVKGMGTAAADYIIKERDTNGKYKDIYDFFSRMNYTIVNKKSIESLVYSGALDSLIDFKRGCFFAKPTSITFLEMLINYGQKVQKESGSMQQSLFDMFSDGSASIQKPKAPSASEGTDDITMLNAEAESIGTYLSAHPLDKFEMLTRKMVTNQLEDLQRTNDLKEQELFIPCIVNSNPPSGEAKATRIELIGRSSQMEVMFWAKEFEQFRPKLYKDYCIMLHGKMLPKFKGAEEYEFKKSSVTLLSDIYNSVTDIKLYLDKDFISKQMIDDLKEVFKQNRGEAALHIVLLDRKADITCSFVSKRIRIAPSKEILDVLDKYYINYEIKKHL
ncbi:MAG: DNA polymerase III subunit alpha [Alistipes sp.]|nr:DNA polymerase III subunit alpha [Candidatus Alistipes equi]